MDIHSKRPTLKASPEGARILREIHDNKKKLMDIIRNEYASKIWTEYNLREIL